VKRVLSCALMLAALVACRDSRHSPTAPRTITVLPAIVDARNDDARPGFYFLAPIRPIAFPVPWSGVFDATLSPVVEICEWSGTACASPLISRLTMTDGLEIEIGRAHV